MARRTLAYTLALALTVGATTPAFSQSLHDIVLTRIEFCASLHSCGGEISDAGQTFVSVFVRNVGAAVTESSPDVSVRLAVNGSVAGVRSLGRLDAGEERRVTFAVRITQPGAYNVTAIADPEKRLSELNGDDNTASATLTVADRVQPSVPSLVRGGGAADPAPHSPAPAPATVVSAPTIQASPQGLGESTFQGPPPASASPPQMVPGGARVPDPDQSVPVETLRVIDAVQGRLSGTITSAATGGAVGGAGVGIYDAFGQIVDWQITDAAGQYVSRPLPEGIYQVAALSNPGWQDTLFHARAVTRAARITLRHGESFRHATGADGPPASGDFYLAFVNDRPQFWSDAVGQRGTLALGDLHGTPLEMIVPPAAGCIDRNPWPARATTPCYWQGGIDAVLHRTYVSLPRAGDPDGYTIFRVVDLQPGLSVTLALRTSPGVSAASGVAVHAGATSSGVDLSLTAVPSIDAVTPARGPAEGGTPVMINGANFSEGAIVMFGGAAASDVSVLSPAQIVATAPPHAGGAADVEVWNPDGAAAAANRAFWFDVPAPAAFAKHAFDPRVPVTDPAFTLAWQESGGAATYQLCIDTTGDNECEPDPRTTNGWMHLGSGAAIEWPRRAFTPGVTYFWQVRALNTNGATLADDGEWGAFSAADVTIAELMAPKAAELMAGAVLFEWTAGANVLEYRLEIGSAPGLDDLFSAATTSRSVIVTGLPEDGRPLFVRIGSRFDLDWLFKDYVFAAAKHVSALGLGSGGMDRASRSRH